jgi:hypothetical protein
VTHRRGLPSQRMVVPEGAESAVRLDLPKRELAFEVRFALTRGVLKYGERQVGEVTGRLVAPIPAWYQPRPSPGQYTFDPPQRGQLPDEVIVETMGSLDVTSLLEEIQPPATWPVIPAELLVEMILEADIEFEGVAADDEYAANEPGDLDEGRRRFEGRWKLTIGLPLEGNFRRDEAQLSLDRMELELDARFAHLEEL